MTSAPASVTQWIEAIAEEGDAMEGLAANYQFLLNNYEALVSGEVDPLEMPYFDEELKQTIFYAALFGTAWEPAHPSYHIVYGAKGIHSLHQHEDQAAAIAAESDDRWVETADVEDTEPVINRYLESCKNSGELSAVANNLQWLRDNVEASDVVELKPSVLPNGEPFMKVATMHSVVFGTLAMLERPDGEFVVIDSGDVTGVYVDRDNAEAAAPRGGHVEALQPADEGSSGVLKSIKSWFARRL